MRKINWILLFFFFFATLYGQKKSLFRIGIEAGYSEVDGSLNEKWNVRQDIGTYRYNRFYDRSSESGAGNLQFFYWGIKPQVSFWNNRLNLFSGLRFTTFKGTIGQENDGFFYLRTNNPEAIEFFKVTSIYEKRGYLTIPLEASYTLFTSSILWPGNTFSFYLKGGTEAGLKIYDRSGIDFVSPKMKAYETGILREAAVGPNPFYATLYGAAGMRFTVRENMQYHLEFFFPSEILTKNNSGIISPKAFSGFQFSVQFPISMFYKKK